LEQLERSLRRQLLSAFVVMFVAVAAVQGRVDDVAPSRRSSDRTADRFAGLPAATLTASARGVETDARIVGIDSLSLTGRPSIAVTGHLPGEESVIRRFAVSSQPFTLRGRDMDLAVTTLIRPNEVVVSGGSVSIENVTVKGTVTLVADRVTSATIGEEPSVRRGSVTFVADGTAELQTAPSAAEAAPARWTDAPRTIRVDDPERSVTDWAGTGTVHVQGFDYTHEWGALASRGFAGTIVRGPGKVTVKGKGRAQQVYLDGEPKLWTTASCDLVQIREETAAGRELELTWAPRNTGEADMVMRRIVPIGPAARWLSLGLEGPLDRFGGEMRPARRGDATGFRSGLPIRSVLPPGNADRRDIGVSVPRGTPDGRYDATVRIEGNFDSVIVPFEVIVVSASPPAG
jgi:hypothetical protein